LDERYCFCHAATENIYRSDFVRQSCTLGGCHLRFVLEDRQRCDVVLDLLKAGQNRLAVVWRLLGRTPLWLDPSWPGAGRP
jgi:hypothetical protein